MKSQLRISSDDLLLHLLVAATGIRSTAKEAKVYVDILVEHFEQAAMLSESIECSHDRVSDHVHRSFMLPTNVKRARQSLAACLEALEEESRTFLKLVARNYAK